MGRSARLAVVALILGSAMGFLWFLGTRGAGDDPQEVRGPTSATPTVTAAEPTVVVPASVEEAADADERPARIAARVDAPVEPEPQGFVLVGRVVDEQDRPLADVNCTLSGYREWATGHEVPTLPEDERFFGWTTSTDVDGRFRIAGPVPTVEGPRLVVEADAHRAQLTERFGGRYDKGRGPLVRGERDLGTLRLARAGAIRGTVRDAEGRPLGDAKLDVGDEPWTTRGFGGTSEVDGSFLVSHVEPGTHGLDCELEGFLDAFQKPIVVEAGRTAGPIEFVLERAPTISGRVVDPDGVPVAGVRVWGWPKLRGSGGGSGAGATTEADGTFVVYLPQADPYSLEPQLSGLSAMTRRDHFYEPGATDIELVVEREVTTRFVVLDDETGEPVRRFGLRILRNMGEKVGARTMFGGVPSEGDRPDGTLEVGARPGLDRFDVMATGYLRTQGEVAHDEGTPGVQTVRLTAGPGVTGRILHAGRPVSDLRVQLVQGSIQEGGSRVTFGRAALGRGLAEQLAAERRPELRIDRDTVVAGVTDGNGRFLVRGLVPRSPYLLETRDSARGVLRKFDVRVDEGTHDLGDLELQAPGRLAGAVVGPAGLDVSGLEIQLDEWKDHRVALTDASGAFLFENLAPGPHVVLVRGRPGAFASSPGVLVEVEAGATRDVTLDLREHGATTVVVRVRGLDPEDGGRWKVWLERPPDLPPVAGSASALSVGQLGVDGVASGSVRAIGPARVVLEPPTGLRFVPESELLDLLPGDTVELELEPTLGVLVVAPPPVLPASGSFRLALDGDRTTVTVKDGVFDQAVFASLDAEGRLVLPYVPLGEHEVSVVVQDDASDWIDRPASDGRSWNVRPSVYEHTARVMVTADAPTILELP